MKQDAGLGLADFLNHGKDKGGARAFLKAWKKAGSIVVWLSTRAAPGYPTWNHPFMERGTYEDKKTHEEVEVLRFPRFVSPDPEKVHLSQYFRWREGEAGPTGHMKIPPVCDPFLLLREWLRLECDLPLDTVVFEWFDPKKKEVIQWKRGSLAKLVDRTKATAYHTLDTKLEYMMVVVEDDDPGKGPQLTRVPKSLADSVKAEISAQIESNGDEGDPYKNPYAFKWKFDADARAVSDYYKAFRLNKARLTDEIRDAITKADYPDPNPDCFPRPGDKARIRAAMEEAAQIDLPWDRIFVPQWVDKEPEGGSGTDFDFGENAKTKSSETRAPEVGRDDDDEKSSKGPKTRRKKKDKPKPPPEPERIPCDDCGFGMLPTDTKCEKCGSEYEVDEDEDGEAPTQASTQAQTKSSSSEGRSDKCWSCGGKVEEDQCQDCGLEVSDDFPY